MRVPFVRSSLLILGFTQTLSYGAPVRTTVGSNGGALLGGGSGGRTAGPPGGSNPGGVTILPGGGISRGLGGGLVGGGCAAPSLSWCTDDASMKDNGCWHKNHSACQTIVQNAWEGYAGGLSSGGSTNLAVASPAR